MDTSGHDVRETLRGLRQTPRHLERAASGRHEEELRRAPAAGEWSLLDVLAHLRGAANVQGGWIARMLAEETPTIRYASPRTGMRKLVDDDREFGDCLGEFTRRRTALVKDLSALEPADWGRSATFTGTTPGWTQTVFDVATGIARHEHSHFDQISAAPARRASEGTS